MESFSIVKPANIVIFKSGSESVSKSESFAFRCYQK